MNFLQAPDANRIAMARSYGFACSLGSAHRSNTGDAISDGGPANRLLIAERVRAGRRINNQLKGAGLQQVNRVRPALIDLKDRLALHPGSFDRSGRPTRGGEFEPNSEKRFAASTASGLCRSLTLINTVPFHRKRRTGAKLRFRKRFAEVFTDTHHFAGRAHFRP